MNRGDRAGRILGDLAQARVIGLGAAEDRVDECRAGRPKIQRGQCSTVGRLYQGLIFGGREEQLFCAVAIVVEGLDARSEAAGSLLVSDELRTNKTAPKLGAEMWSVEATENSMPVGVIALCAKKKIPGLLQL